MSSSEPVSARLRMMHHPCLKLGALVGVCLAVIGAAWVLIANRRAFSTALRLGA